MNKSVDKQRRSNGEFNEGNTIGFKKGQSGNPKGRKPKEKCLTELMRQILKEQHPTDDTNRTWLQMIVEATLRLAIRGNATALKEVWERMDGKVPIKTNADSEKDCIMIISDQDLPKRERKNDETKG